MNKRRRRKYDDIYQTVNGVNEKLCSICLTWKPLDEFSKLCSDCKTCRKKYRQSNKGKTAQQKAGKKYYQSSKGKTAKRKADEKYYDTINGYLQHLYHRINNRCKNPTGRNIGYKGIKNKFESPNDFRNYVINILQVDPRGLEIHRIDNGGHYEKGNIEFITEAEHEAKHKQINKENQNEAMLYMQRK